MLLPKTVDWDDVRAAILQLDGRNTETIRTHRRLWGDFERWCNEKGCPPLPASIETVALYLCYVAPAYKLTSLSNILSAITYVHRLNGFAFSRNFLKPILNGIGRVHGGGMRKKPAIELNYLRTLVEQFPNHKRGLRDRAIFMIGFCGGLRCEELAHMDYVEFQEDAIGRLHFDRDGAAIEMRYRGNARTRARKVLKFIPRCSEFCPVRALEDWIAEAQITRGPLFRAVDKHGNVGETRLPRSTMSVLLRRALRDAEVARGRSPAEAAEIARPYTVQSLRIGFIKSALEAGVKPERIAMHLGLTTAQCIEQYKRRYKTFRDNPLLAVMAGPEPAGDPTKSGIATLDLPTTEQGWDGDSTTPTCRVGISRDEFLSRYGIENDCREALVRWRWPDGFRCPRCQQSRHSYFRGRRAYRCSACRLQTTAKSGTIFHNSLLPLTKWFYAYYLLQGSKTDVTPRQLASELNIKWDTAQRVKRTLTKAMGDENEGLRLA